MLAAVFSNKRHPAIKSATYWKQNDGVNSQVAFALLWPKGATATWGHAPGFASVPTVVAKVSTPIKVLV